MPTKKTKRIHSSQKPGITTLYSYVKKVNGRFARTSGARRFTTYSQYIDHLIERDRKLQARNA